MTLYEIKSSDFSADAVSMANGLYHKMASSDFIISLIVVKNTLKLTRPLTKSLQSRSMDMLLAKDYICSLITVLQQTRENVDGKHQEYYTEANTLSRLVHDSEISAPRAPNRSTLRENPPSTTPSEYFKFALTIPFLDHLIAEMKERFSETNITRTYSHYLIPCNFDVTNADSVKCLRQIYQINSH